MRAALKQVPPSERVAAAYARAGQLADEDVETCRLIGHHGQKLIAEIAARKQGRVNILTHCNAGWLACVDWGTALSPIYQAHDAGVPVHVWVDETRPRNQGAALTAFELGAHGVPHTIIADNAGGHLMQHGQVDLCIVGCDRLTAAGDAANKIGTYLKALAAKDNGVPFYVALPESTVDWTISDGVRDIPIEERERGRGHAYDRACRKRRGAHRAGNGAGQPRRQPRLRCHPRAAHHRPDDRTRHRPGDARGPGAALPEMAANAAA